jgi:CheY-like chemotaxis protein
MAHERTLQMLTGIDSCLKLNKERTMATILVVDDRSTNREMLKELLCYKGYRVLVAGDGAEALAIAKAELPQLIISDILMSTMDGFGLVRRLREDSTTAAIPVIFNTGIHLDHKAMALAEAYGVAFLLYKPSEPEEILSTVDAVLNNSTLRPSGIGLH